MILIPLDAVANQSFTINLDGSSYDIAIKETNGVMAANIVRDGATLLLGTRIVAGTPLIPYDYLQLGNFILTTENDEIPYYTQFGVTQQLLYASIAEIGEISAGT